MANLLLAALFLEAARMIDDGFDISAVERAAKKTFGIPKGFLAKIDEVGIDRVVAFLEYLSDISDPENELAPTFNNFFAPPKILLDIRERYNAGEEKSAVVFVSGKDVNKTASDFIHIETLGLRFKAIAFMAATELVESEIIELPALEKFCTSELKWIEGPFSMMNSMGLSQALRIVSERMFLSHRKEINFPIPRLLIMQAQKNTTWIIDF